jgi:hypothetical protein
VLSIPALTAGSIPFVGASGSILQDNANFFWDDTNNRLGIGTATPTADLEVAGASTNIFINGGTAPLLRFSTASVAAPTFTTRSAGTRLVLYPNVSGSTVDFALGVATGTLWSAVGQATPSNSFKWYGGTTELASLTGDGVFQVNGTLQVVGASTDIFINGSTSALLRFPTASIGPPTFTTRSNSTRLVLYPFVGGSTVDFALGIETGTLWSSIGEATSAYNFKWYGGTTELARLTGDRTLQLSASTGAVSDANTGRLRYNTTGEKFQISKNAVAYEDMASLATAQTFTKSQNVLAVALTDAANIATDASLGNVFTVTLAGNRTLDNPSNLVSGGVYRWVVTQDATGSRTLAYGALFKWPGGTAPVLSTGANAVDYIQATYNGTVLLATFDLNFS